MRKRNKYKTIKKKSYKRRVDKKYIGLKKKIIIYIGIILTALIIFIYAFDRIVTPTVMVVSEAEMKAKSLEVINKAVLNQFGKNFKYDEVMKIKKDNQDSIYMMQADTLKLNQIASKVALTSSKELNELGNVGIKLPIGYITKNNILSYMGISITVKMQPIGYVEAMYQSEFQTAGINQTKHTIYVNVKCKVRIILPTESREVEVKHKVAVAETIIVGKVPKTALQLQLDQAGFNTRITGE